MVQRNTATPQPKLFSDDSTIAIMVSNQKVDFFKFIMNNNRPTLFPSFDLDISSSTNGGVFFKI